MVVRVWMLVVRCSKAWGSTFRVALGVLSVGLVDGVWMLVVRWASRASGSTFRVQPVQF